MRDDERDQLVTAARDARDRAYAPYSHFSVGAAVLTTSGEVFAGCNVENASYGLTLCAERAALVAAVTAGERRFQALAVATAGGHAPCGACRQFVAEFCEDLPILLVDTNLADAMTKTRLQDLLPMRFEHPPP